jgi:hypothetical protein
MRPASRMLLRGNLVYILPSRGLVNATTLRDHLHRRSIMKRRSLVLGLTLVVGMLMGAYTLGFLHAQAQVKRTTLVHADMASIAGKEADAWIAEFPRWPWIVSG